MIRIGLALFRVLMLHGDVVVAENMGTGEWLLLSYSQIEAPYALAACLRAP